MKLTIKYDMLCRSYPLSINMSLIRSNFDIDHLVSQEVFIDVRDKKQHKLPPYKTFGRAGFSRDRIEGINVSLILAELSPAATWLFWNLDNVRDYRTNTCIFKASQLSQAQKLKLTRGYKELKEKGLVVRIKNQHYLINPKILLPDFKEYLSVKVAWDKATNLSP